MVEGLSETTIANTESDRDNKLADENKRKTKIKIIKGISKLYFWK